ncbi:NADPH dependent alkenal/alkenone reductase [Cladochytrium replicatum]|nr:NADPH dependent alkenal/alkenone reductase [Cladochytrium replicatum]
MSEHYQILLKEYAVSGPVKPETFEIRKSSTPAHNASELKDNQILAEPIYLSVDPYMRNRFRPSKSYIPSFTVGGPIGSYAVLKVLESRHPNLAVGDFVSGLVDWKSAVILDGDKVTKLQNVHKLSLSYYVGALGMPGMTAYASLHEFAEPLLVPGNTVFVSAAAGAVGQLVGQICKLKGMKVIGSAGSDEKVEFLKTQLGFDGAFNYKNFPTADDILKELLRLAPEGTDLYYENVGGMHLHAALNHLKVGGKIIACGMISGYDGDSYHVPNLSNIVGKQISIHGFLVTPLTPKYKPAFAKDMPAWIAEGKVKVVEEIREGWENAGLAFIEMMSGKNLGKMVVKVGEDPNRK